MRSFFKSFLRNAWEQSTQIDKLNVILVISIGSSAHFGFYFLFKYGFGLYENFTIRITAVILSILLGPIYIKRNHYPKIYLEIYWHLTLIYVLPFVFTVNLLKTNFNELWLYWEIFMIFILIMYAVHWLIFLIDLFLGVSFAILYYFLTSNSFAELNFHSFDVVDYLTVIVFSAVTGLLFGYAARASSLSIQQKQHERILALTTGSIVHEIRNPLNAISLSSSNIAETLNSDKENKISKLLLEFNHDISNSVAQANKIINIVLSDIKNKPVDISDFSYLRSRQILPEIVDKYGYKNLSEKEKVKLNLPIVSDKNRQSDFIFKAIPDRLAFVIYNLLKNALYYRKEYPDSIVTIGVEARIFKGKEWNVIYVHDTGPGIKPKLLENLFGEFFTSGKKEGTGLGLAFCKRNMKIFGGDIICESELGQGKSGWTKFSLLFPKISEEEIKNSEVNLSASSAQKNLPTKKILIVDDQETNLITAKSKIEKNLSYISCDVAASGEKAISLCEKNNYDLILMDFQMPEMNGLEATKKIKTFNQEVPIIAFTSLEHEAFLQELEMPKEGNKETQKEVQKGENKTHDNLNKNWFNGYLSKSSSSNILLRTVTKWLIGEDDLAYLGDKENYAKQLQGKEIILADDQDLNRVITARTLAMAGLKITEVRDGKELLEIYENSLDKNGKSKFSLIVTDINMSPFNGDDAALKVRALEVKNKISYQNRIPIIALSGDGQKQDIFHFFECEVDDYFIKGSSPEILTKIVANYIGKLG